MRWAVAALTALGGVVRFATLDAKGFWQDEATTAILMREPAGRGGGCYAGRRRAAAAASYSAVNWCARPVHE